MTSLFNMRSQNGNLENIPWFTWALPIFLSKAQGTLCHTRAMGFQRRRGRKCQTCLGKADVLLGLLFMLLLNVLYVVFKRNWRHGCHWTKCNLLILCITEEYFCSPKRSPRNLTWADWEGTISKWAVYVAQKYWRHLAPAKAIWNISICTQILTRKKC